MYSSYAQYQVYFLALDATFIVLIMQINSYLFFNDAFEQTKRKTEQIY